MGILDVIVLGVVQGLSEFIPISSSGHLFLFIDYLNLKQSEYDVSTVILSMHIGTLIAVIFHYRSTLWGYVYSIYKHLKRKKRKGDTQSINEIIYVTIATIPIVVVGLIFREKVESFYENDRDLGVFFTSIGLILVGIFYLIVEEFWNSSRKNLKTMSYLDSLFIGIGQCFAIFFGVSRSGSTISFGMIRGLNRKSATDFSFLMSIPAISGAIFLEIYDMINDKQVLETEQIYLYLIGIVVSFISGLWAIKFLIKHLQTHSLSRFAIYCIVFGVVNIFFVIDKL